MRPCCATTWIFQSTHPLRGATYRAWLRKPTQAISIHAPLAGCDYWEQPFVILLFISIHAPLAGCDLNSFTGSAVKIDFNPRTPCGVRHSATGAVTFKIDFNPRPPCGVRRPIASTMQIIGVFQSTHPLRGATSMFCSFCQAFLYFNPRTPCGVRLCAGNAPHLWRRFQSTHPLRGATRDTKLTASIWQISIHAPLAGCDKEDHL